MGPPGHGRVDVWLMSLRGIDDGYRRAYQTLLTTAEITRWRRFLVQDPADQYLAARALLRSRLALYTRTKPDAWIFDRNHYGRPFVMEPRQFRTIRFNLSHTHGLVACAFSAHEIGVDTEHTTRELDFMGLAASSFSALEAAHLKDADSKSVRSIFYSYWTLKESYIKARGMGLSIPLDSFWFELNESWPRLFSTVRCGDNGSSWQFRQMQPTPEHAVAIAVGAALDMPLEIQVHWANADLSRGPSQVLGNNHFDSREGRSSLNQDPNRP